MEFALLERLRQMCCWFLKVFLLVSRNLAVRVLRDAVDAVYRCCCDNRAASEDADDRNETGVVVDRTTCESVLADRGDGTFLLRPSSSPPDVVATLSVALDGRVRHLKVRRRSSDGKVALGNEKPNEMAFRDADALVDYYVSNYLVLRCADGKVRRTLLMPYELSAKGTVARGDSSGCD